MERSNTYPGVGQRRNRTPWRLIALVVLGAFLLGALATWMFTRDEPTGLGDLISLRSEDETPAETAAPGTQPLPTPESSEATAVVADEARQAVERVEQVEEQAGGIDQRVAAMEQRLTRLDLQSQAAMGNAARAEGLLIAFATRRAIERGNPLGYLEDQLRLRFGDARPNAVQTVIDAAASPVTLEQLLTRLNGIAPELENRQIDKGLFSWLGSELSKLVVVRTDDTPSPIAERRLDRARMLLERGDVTPAITEVRNMPNAEAAADWLADAERYSAAQRALEVLETAAILEPRELRDSIGNQVTQPGLSG